MALVPLSFLGFNPEDFSQWQLSPLFSKNFPHHHDPWSSLEKSLGSQLVSDKDKYQVCLDVQQFSPAEVSVKTVGRRVVVEGRHEEKQDEHGCVSRHFVRKYTLPDGHATEDVVSSMSPDGVLTITAPKKQVAVEGERIVPIQASGPLHRTTNQTNQHNTPSSHRNVTVQKLE